MTVRFATTAEEPSTVDMCEGWAVLTWGCLVDAGLLSVDAALQSAHDFCGAGGSGFELEVVELTTCTCCLGAGWISAANGESDPCGYCSDSTGFHFDNRQAV